MKQQQVSGYKRNPYTYKRKGKTVRVPETTTAKFSRRNRGKGKLMKRRNVKYKPRKRKFDEYGQFK